MKIKLNNVLLLSWSRYVTFRYTPYKNVGKCWEPNNTLSRHIDHGNRLVYNIVDGNLWIASCKGHYED